MLQNTGIMYLYLAFSVFVCLKKQTIDKIYKQYTPNGILYIKKQQHSCISCVYRQNKDVGLYNMRVQRFFFFQRKCT